MYEIYIVYVSFNEKHPNASLQEPPSRNDGPHLPLPLPGAQPRSPGHGTPPEPPKQRRFSLGKKMVKALPGLPGTLKWFQLDSKSLYQKLVVYGSRSNSFKITFDIS